MCSCLIPLGRWDAFGGTMVTDQGRALQFLTNSARLAQSMGEGSKQGCWTSENGAYAQGEGKYLAKSPGNTVESAVL